MKDAPGPDAPRDAARALESRAHERVARLLEAENRERARGAAITVTAALAALAPVIAVLSGWPEALFYHGLLAVFAVALWGQYLAARRFTETSWPDYAFVAFYFALLTFTLLAPNPLSEFADPPALPLHLGNFLYFFVMLAALGFSFSPALVLWGGLCGAAFWSFGRLWIALRPGVTTDLDIPPVASQAEHEAALRAMLGPAHVDLGVWLQEAAVFLVVAGMLAQVVRGSRALVARQARLERRGANLERYLPREMAERMAEADEPFLADREVTAGVMFTDIVGFTGWAEGRDPEEVVAMLREVHGMVAEEVFRARGVLDKFIGDGSMATFGVAPAEDDPDPVPDALLARRALGCAERLLVRMAEWNLQRVARGQDAVRLSIGLHLGEVVVGDVGSPGRMELAAVGDTVNVAARLEALSRPLDCGAVASAEVISAAGAPDPGWRFRGVQSLPGRRSAETVWTRDHDPRDPAAAMPRIGPRSRH